MKTLAYIGTYTDEKQEGIHIVEADPASGALRRVGVVGGIEDPTYLALSRRRPLLYAVQGMAQYGSRDRHGAVAVYRIDGANLTLLGHRPVGVTVPCHIALSPDERLLAFAEYSHAVAGVFELATDGTFADRPPATVRHSGSGPDRSRQESAHAHCVAFTPDGRRLCVADLGIDRVLAYDPATRGGGLGAVDSLTIASAGGAGPRHLVFHPNGRFAFLLHELDNTLTALRFTGEAFVPLQTLSTIPEGFTAFSKASALKLTADGRRLLASNRGHDSIAAFAVDPASGRLDPLAISPLAGAFPRDFALFPGEAFVLVGHEKSDTVCTYAFDAASGRLTPTAAAPVAIHRPVCTLFGANVWTA